MNLRAFEWYFVEKMGLEPTTSCMPCKRSSQLSYIPVRWCANIRGNPKYQKGRMAFTKIFW